MCIGILKNIKWVDIEPNGQVLTQLIEFCQNKEMHFACVQGPSGSGKTRILLELIKILSFNQQDVFLTLEGNRKESVTKYINQYFTTAERSKSLVLNALENHEHCFVLIDNAEEIVFEQFKLFWDWLLENDELRESVTVILYIGTSPIQIEFIEMLKQSHIFTLAPMSTSQVTKLVEHIYKELGLDHNYSLPQLAKLHSMSYGYPGRVLKLIEGNIKSKRMPVSNARWISIFTIFLVVALGWFLFSTFFKTKEIAPDVNIASIDAYHNESEVSFPASAESDKQQEETIQNNEGVIEPNLVDDEDVNSQEEPSYTPSKIVTVPMVIEESSIPQVHSNISPGTEKIVENIIEETKLNEPIAQLPQKNQDKYYVIELARGKNRSSIENSLKGRSIPGKPQFSYVMENGKRIFIAYIGPYSSKKQAEAGKEKLPYSVKQLPLRIHSSSDILK